MPVTNKRGELVRYTSTPDGWVVERLAKHRSHPFGYWDLPRAAISADGSTIVAGSNFGISGNRRVIALRGGGQLPKPPRPPAVLWEVSAGQMPAGLALNSETGEIAGIPELPGEYIFTISATTDGGSGLREYTVTIQVAPVPLVGISPDTLPPGQVGRPYKARLEVSRD